ncbi:hypothetical protein TrST_g11825 [Triparma strigata]|uniref:THUMP domain-containing protein n=1 Tax=Triparma strigata TaxID=1606541 RepID=A0A9W7F551_9STRA|nr:hypothetical protein TrST_g11825 [Triparma strigata]
MMFDPLTSRYLKLLQKGTLEELTPECLYALVYSSFDYEILKKKTKGTYKTFSITSTLLGLSSTPLSNSQITSRTIKDALVSSLFDTYGSRPDVEKKEPEVPFFVKIQGREVEVYVSLISKTSNHMLRSYRGPITHAGALRPTTASLLSYKSGVSKLAQAVRKGEVDGMKIVDPMCGSGTLLFESFYLVTGCSPYRIWLEEGGIPVWSRLGYGDLEECRKEVEKREEEGMAFLEQGKVTFVGNDKVGGNLKMVRESCEVLGLRGRHFNTHCNGVSEFTFDAGDGVAISLCNPPWPEGRIGGDDPDLEGTWEALGEWSKRNLKGQEMWVLAPPTELSGVLRMKAKRAMKFRQGKDELRWSQYLINK